MSSCYSGDHIAEDHTYSDITTHSFEEPEQKYHLGTASNILLGLRGGGGGGRGLNMFYCWKAWSMLHFSLIMSTLSQTNFTTLV